jgi:hypothetical protein
LENQLHFLTAKGRKRTRKETAFPDIGKRDSQIAQMGADFSKGWKMERDRRRQDSREQSERQSHEWLIATKNTISRKISHA